MRKPWLHAASLFFGVVTVRFVAGTKIGKIVGGQRRAQDESSTVQQSDGLSLLTQLQQVVSARTSAPTQHVATPEYLARMEMMASNLAKMKTSNTSSSPFQAITQQMKATITGILHVRVNGDLVSLSQKMAAFENLFSVCETNRNAGMQAAVSKQQEVPALASSHVACRTEESVKLADKNACTASLQTSRLVRTTGCDIVIHYGSDDSTSLCAPRLSETPEQYNRRMIFEFKARLETIRSQKSLCQNASTAVSSQQSACTQEETDWQQKRQSCNSAQETLDNKACEFGLMMNSTCEAYKTCRSQTMYSFSLANETTHRSQRSLRAEYQTLKRVECLLDSIGGSSEQLQRCMEIIFDASHLKVNHSEPPDCQPCETLAEQPGTAEYNQTVYASLPESAPAAPCTASCCIAI